MTFTAQAGLQIVEAAKALRKQKLQFMLNIEIGNITLGSAACCQTKDALDGVEFGQVNSYVTGVKWVSPSGTLEEASEDEESRSCCRASAASYGLAGIVYEVTFRIKPLEIIRFNYDVHDVEELTQDDGRTASSRRTRRWCAGRSADAGDPADAQPRRPSCSTTGWPRRGGSAGTSSPPSSARAIRRPPRRSL